MNLKKNFIPRGNTNFDNDKPIFMSNYGLHPVCIYHPVNITSNSDNIFIKNQFFFKKSDNFLSLTPIENQVIPNINNIYSPIDLYKDDLYLKIKNIDLYRYSRLNKK